MPQIRSEEAREMKREVEWVLFGTFCLVVLMISEKAIPVILGDLEDIYIEDYLLEPLGGKARKAVSNEKASRGSYLMLELSASSRDDEMLVPCLKSSASNIGKIESLFYA
jgi:hypothetical protein